MPFIFFDDALGTREDKVASLFPQKSHELYGSFAENDLHR